MTRLNLVDPKELPEGFDAEEKIPDELKAGRNVGDERRVQTARTHRGWENNPPIHKLHNETFLTLWRKDITGLTPRETELVILAIVRECRSKLEWNVHVSTGLDVGIDEEDLIAIFDGELQRLDEKDTALAQYCLAFSHMEVTDEIHENLAKFYDDKTIVGIMELAGFYVLCALIIDAMGIETVDPNDRVDHLSFENLSA